MGWVESHKCHSWGSGWTERGYWSSSDSGWSSWISRQEGRDSSCGGRAGWGSWGINWMRGHDQQDCAQAWGSRPLNHLPEEGLPPSLKYASAEESLWSAPKRMQLAGARAPNTPLTRSQWQGTQPLATVSKPVLVAAKTGIAASPSAFLLAAATTGAMAASSVSSCRSSLQGHLATSQPSLHQCLPHLEQLSLEPEWQTFMQCETV